MMKSFFALPAAVTLSEAEGRKRAEDKETKEKSKDFHTHGGILFLEDNCYICDMLKD